MRYRLNDGKVEIWADGWVGLYPANPSRLIPALLALIEEQQHQIKALQERRHRPFNPNVDP